MRNDTLLMCAVGIVGANSLVLAPVSATVGADLGREAVAIMGAAAAFGLSTALSALFLAPLIDRLGAGRMAVASMATLGLALAASGVSPVFATLVLAQVLAGAASGVALPAAYALAAEIAPPGREAAVLGRVLTGWTLAIAFGVTLSAVLADLVHWRAVFAITACGAFGLALALRSLPNGPRGPVTLPWSALPLPGVSRGLIVQGILMIAFYGTYSFLGAHMEQQGWTTLQSAVPVLAYGIGFGLSGTLDPWLDRRGYGGAGPVVFLAVATALGCIALFGSSFWGLTAAFLGWGLANHLALGLTVGRVTAAGGARRGAVLGLNSAVTYLAVVGGAAGFAPIFAQGGLTTCAAIGALCGLALALEAISLRGKSRAAPG